jgi:flagellar hook-associated protein 2
MVTGSSSSPISFSGLASGLNTSSIIQELVAAAEAPEQQLQSEQSDLASKTTIVNQLSSDLSSLGNLASGMSLDSQVQYRTATASDSSVSVAVSGDAAVQTHSVAVQQLASAQVVTSNTYSTDAAGAAGAGSVTIQTGSGKPQTVTWSSSDTLEDIAQDITNANAGVTASVLNNGSSYQIVVSADKTGTANAATFTETGNALGLSDSKNQTIAAQNCELTVDGISVTRPTNVIDDVVPGMTITANAALAAGAPPTQVSVSVDQSQITTQLQSFVTDYNAVMTDIGNQLNYTGSTAATSTLFGDPTLEQLQETMEGLATSFYGNNDSMTNLGLTVNDTGQLSLNTTTLQTALNSDPNALSTLFVSGGLSQAVTNMVTAYTESGDGILTQLVSNYSQQTSDLQSQINTIQANGTTLQTQLQDEYNNLETTMSQLNSQSTYVTKILDSSGSSSSSG